MLGNSLQGIGEHYIAFPWNRLMSPVTSKTEPSGVCFGVNLRRTGVLPL